MSVPSFAAAGVRPALEVLIVDDNATYRAAARAILAMSDSFSVVGEVESGEQAVEAIRRLSPDVVLMDVRLPGIDGIEATRRVLAECPSTAVVLISTLQRRELPAGADSCGAVGFLAKHDLEPDALESLLR